MLDSIEIQLLKIWPFLCFQHSHVLLGFNQEYLEEKRMIFRIAAFFLASSMLFAAASQSRTFTGIITDSMCGKDHSAMKISPADNCIRECVSKYGSKYALYDGKNVYILSDQKRPSSFAAKKVKITGTLDETTKVLKVESIQALK